MSSLLQTDEWAYINEEWIYQELELLERKKQKIIKNSRLSEENYNRVYELELEIEHWYEVLEILTDVEQDD